MNFRALEQTLERRKLLARTPRVGAMELVVNLPPLALRQARVALLLGAKMDRMSVADRLHVLRRATEAVRAGRPTRWFRRAAVRDQYLRKRPKNSRDYPRKKRDSPTNPPQILNLTTAQETQIDRLNSLEVPIYG